VAEVERITGIPRQLLRPDLWADMTPPPLTDRANRQDNPGSGTPICRTVRSRSFRPI
jgi:hypothetical protein